MQEILITSSLFVVASLYFTRCSWEMPLRCSQNKRASNQTFAFLNKFYFYQMPHYVYFQTKEWPSNDFSNKC